MLRQEMPGWCERANVPVRGQKKEGKWESHEDLRKTWPDPMDISIAKTLARGSSRVEGLRLQSCWHGRLGRLLLQWIPNILLCRLKNLTVIDQSWFIFLKHGLFLTLLLSCDTTPVLLISQPVSCHDSQFTLFSPVTLWNIYGSGGEISVYSLWNFRVPFCVSHSLAPLFSKNTLPNSDLLYPMSHCVGAVVLPIQ